MRARQISPLLGLAIALVPLAAHAEDAPAEYPACEHQPSDTDIQGAKGAFQAGQASFEEGDYARAISYWEDAYRRDCTAHALLLNLARAYELNNQKRHAVSSLETFLARNPSSDQREQIARRIEGLNEKIQKEAGAKTTGSTNPGETGTEPNVTPVPEEKSGGQRPIAPLIVAGAGGALAVLGGILYMGAASDVKDVEDKCPDRKCSDPALIDEGNSARKRQTTWGIVTVGGVAVAAGGLVWYFMSKPKPAATAKVIPLRPRFDPVVGSNFAGVSLSGAF
jgi:tetratricopeptide (TPR) repeat protein